MYPVLKLRQGKEKNAEFRHPWIFSGALEGRPEDVPHGSLVSVADGSGRVVGTGTYSAKSSIAVRLFEFGDAVIDGPWIGARLAEADEKRRLLGYGPGTDTDGYRVVFGEVDGLPGLVVDRFGDVLVLQSSTAGMDALLEPTVGALKKLFKPKAIIERSDLSVRREEGLEDAVGARHGAAPSRVAFSENGCDDLADVMAGQKTGFFLDQKDLRRTVAKLAAGRSMLNLFSYTGAAGIAALKAGAASCHNVDSSQPALDLALEQAALNGIKPKAMTVESADIFQYLGAASQ